MGFYVLCTLYEYVQLHTHIKYYPSIWTAHLHNFRY